MRCDKCQSAVSDDEFFVHSGRNLCEDCYLAVMSRPKTCDVGAVYAARASRELLGQKGAEGLTPLQRKMYDYVKEKGQAPREDVVSYMAGYMNITMEEAREEVEGIFATLRHLELMRGLKEGNTIYLTLM